MTCWSKSPFYTLLLLHSLHLLINDIVVTKVKSLGPFTVLRNPEMFQTTCIYMTPFIFDFIASPFFWSPLLMTSRWLFTREDTMTIAIRRYLIRFAEHVYTIQGLFFKTLCKRPFMGQIDINGLHRVCSRQKYCNDCFFIQL